MEDYLTKLTNNDITESQLKELSGLIIKLNESNGCDKPDFRGDDELMIKSVSEAAKYANGEKNSFLKNYVHIPSSYSHD